MSCCLRPLPYLFASLRALSLVLFAPFALPLRFFACNPKPKPYSPRILEKNVIFADL